MADRIAKQRARYRHIQEIWKKLTDQPFEGSEAQTLVLQVLAEAREDALVEAAQRQMKVWKGTQRAFGDWVLKRKRKAELRTAALKRACRLYVIEDLKTGERKQMTAKSILNSLYAREHIEKEK